MTNPSTTSAAPAAETLPILAWQVHLLRRDPRRFPALLCVLFIAAACVWLMFHAVPPVLAALLLLVGATGEYLFPVRYRLTEEGVFAQGPASRMVLRWEEARRCLPGPGQITLTPLPHPSRLDAFRGVTLRFAPDGAPGDRASVLETVARCAPAVPLPAPGKSPTALPVDSEGSPLSTGGARE
jgi:hypothetical protein